MACNGRNFLPEFLSLIGITLVLGGGLAVFVIGLAGLFATFQVLPSPLPNPEFVTSVGLAYDVLGAILISYDAIAGTGVLAQLSWYLKNKSVPFSERWLMLFYLLKPPLNREQDGNNPYLNEIEQGRDMKNADFSVRAVGEPQRAPSEYNQFRGIQRPTVIKWFGFVLLALGFALQFIAIHLPE